MHPNLKVKIPEDLLEEEDVQQFIGEHEWWFFLDCTVKRIRKLIQRLACDVCEISASGKIQWRRPADYPEGICFGDPNNNKVLKKDKNMLCLMAHHMVIVWKDRVAARNSLTTPSPPFVNAPQMSSSLTYGPPQGEMNKRIESDFSQIQGAFVTQPSPSGTASMRLSLMPGPSQAIEIASHQPPTASSIVQPRSSAAVSSVAQSSGDASQTADYSPLDDIRTLKRKIKHLQTLHILDPSLNINFVDFLGSIWSDCKAVLSPEQKTNLKIGLHEVEGTLDCLWDGITCTSNLESNLSALSDCAENIQCHLGIIPKSFRKNKCDNSTTAIDQSQKSDDASPVNTSDQNIIEWKTKPDEISMDFEVSDLSLLEDLLFNTAFAKDDVDALFNDMANDSGYNSVPAYMMDTCSGDQMEGPMYSTTTDQLIKDWRMEKKASPEDELSVLYSWSASTGVTVDDLKKQLLEKFNFNVDYNNYFSVTREELNKYLDNQSYDFVTVESIPKMLVEMSGRTLYILEDRHFTYENPFLMKITPSSTTSSALSESPVFFLKTLMHYDALIERG